MNTGGRVVSAEVNVIRVNDCTFMLVQMPLLPPGFVLACNTAGWDAVKRGEVPVNGDAVLIRMDTHPTGYPPA